MVEEKLQDWDALYFYVYRLFGHSDIDDQPVSISNIIQMHRYFERGMTYRGQFLTLKYFYEVKKNKVNPRYKTVGV